MISASDYYRRVVHPTSDEFFKSNKDIRLAMLACMCTLHTVDYVFQNKEDDLEIAKRAIDRFNQNGEEINFSYKVVRGFALASKHCRLSTKTYEHLHSKSYMVTYPSYAGEMRAGATFLGDTTGGIAVQWSEHGYVNLTVALKGAHRFLESEFPELCDEQLTKFKGTN